MRENICKRLINMKKGLNSEKIIAFIIQMRVCMQLQFQTKNIKPEFKKNTSYPHGYGKIIINYHMNLTGKKRPLSREINC